MLIEGKMPKDGKRKRKGDGLDRERQTAMPFLYYFMPGAGGRNGMKGLIGAGKGYWAYAGDEGEKPLVRQKHPAMTAGGGDISFAVQATRSRRR
jgi:hypothetical protein